MNNEEYRKLYDTFAEYENNPIPNGLKQYQNNQARLREYRKFEVEDFVSDDELIEEEEEKRKELTEYHGLLEEPEKQFVPPAQKIQDEIFEEVRERRRGRPKKYSQKELDAIRESCKCVYVRDYAEQDPYHLSDKEREEKDILSDIRRELLQVKSGYNNPRDYVKAMRTVLKAWELVAERNGLYTVDEFFDLVARGRLVSPSIPKVVLSNMKNYNKDMLAEYISNPDLDIDDLQAFDDKEESKAITEFNDELRRLHSEYKQLFIDTHKQEYYKELEGLKEDSKEYIKKKSAIDEELEIDASDFAAERVDNYKIRKFFTREEVEEMIKYKENPTPMKVYNLDDKYIKDYDHKGSHKLGKKKLKKTDRLIAKDVHLALNLMETKIKHTDNLWMPTMDSMFGPNKPNKTIVNGFKVKGSLSKKSNYELLRMQQLDDHMSSTDPDNRFQTNGTAMTENMIDTCEQYYDMNMKPLRARLNMTVDGRDRLITDKIRKENKKKEYAIINKWIKLSESKAFKKEAAKRENQLASIQ